MSGRDRVETGTVRARDGLSLHYEVYSAGDTALLVSWGISPGSTARTPLARRSGAFSTPQDDPQVAQGPPEPCADRRFPNAQDR